MPFRKFMATGGVAAEAGLALLLASIVIRVAPLGSVLRSRPRSEEPRDSSVEDQDLAVIRRFIAAWSRRLPWRTMCFEQGLAAHWMLRRRGLASTLYYGAATIDGELKAHVWVKSGERDVVGCEIADDYALLARFPDEPPVSAGSHS
jgi:hypothetical protein